MICHMTWVQHDLEARLTWFSDSLTRLGVEIFEMFVLNMKSGVSYFPASVVHSKLFKETPDIED